MCVFFNLLKKSLILICLSIGIYNTTNAQTNKYNLQNGDIVFQDLDCGPMCNAIEEVTEGYMNRDFSHVAIIILKDTSFYAIEAIGKYVQLSPLETFMSRVPNDKMLKMRLKENFQVLVPKATEIALTYVGKPYDDRFIMNNDSLYCSELIFDAFKSAQSGVPLFSLAPMTYKIPGQHSFYPVWVDYYKALGTKIPEGLPGINPGLLSRSEFLLPIE